VISFQEAIKAHPELKEELEERAAIMEFEGGLKRDVAESLAVTVVLGKKEIQR
jgi:hypothetical protein